MASDSKKWGVENAKKYVLSKGLDSFFQVYTKYTALSANFSGNYFFHLFEMQEIIRQCYQIGVRSLPLISLTGFIIGIVFTKQSRPSLAAFGATSWLPSLISIAIIKALAPLVTALICAGKVGSNIGAELGSMRVTEQIDAMEVSATNPFKFLVVTRIVATTLMMPILMMYTAVVGMLGSYLNVHAVEQTSFSAFFENGFETITFLDIEASIFKSLVFGFTIGVSGCFQGTLRNREHRGVGKAANTAVVVSMFLVFIEELIIVQVVNAIR